MVKQCLAALLVFGATVLLSGCNLTTDRPLFGAEDAAELRLETGYYATGTGVAYIKVYGGRTVVSTQADSRVPYEGMAIDLGRGLYLLQYGEVTAVERTYVLFRYEADGKGISTAVYDCAKDAAFFQNFGIAIVADLGQCRMSGVTRERLVRASRAVAAALPEDSWHRTYRAVSSAEGARLFKERDGFSRR